MLQARDDLTDAMCKKEMGVYTAIFGTTGDTAALERTDRRYLWLRKRLGSRQEVQFLPRLTRLVHSLPPSQAAKGSRSSGCRQAGTFRAAPSG